MSMFLAIVWMFFLVATNQRQSNSVWPDITCHLKYTYRQKYRCPRVLMLGETVILTRDSVENLSPL